MSRLKTSAFWIFFALALGAGIYAYFNLKSNKKPPRSALSVIPDKCLVYLNTGDFAGLNKKINSQSLIVDKLKAFGEVNLLCSTLHLLDSMIATSEELRDVLKNNPVHFALYAEKHSWLAAFNLKQLGEQKEIVSQLSSVLYASAGMADLYAFRLRGMPLYFNLTDGIVTFSNRQELIIRALNPKTPRLENNPSFAQFKSTLTENGLLSMYVDHKLYAASDLAGSLNLSYASKNGYSAGAIEVQPSQLKVTGYIQPGEDDLISWFVDQAAQKTADFLDYLPAGTQSFKAFGFSSYPEFRLSFPLTNVHIKFWVKANEKGLYNVEDDFHENIVDHLVEAGSGQQAFIYAAVNDTVKAADNLKFMSDSLYQQDSLTFYKFNDKTGAPLQLFLPLSEVATTYAVLYRSHIFFAEKAEQLARVVRDIGSGLLLLNDESFMSYRSQHFPEQFNYLAYGAPHRLRTGTPEFFNLKATEKENPFENFKHISFAVTNQNNTYKFRFHLLNENENRSKEQNVLWTLDLDNPCLAPAGGFINHTSGENEIVVQDEANVLYLVNAKGTVLWKKQLDEKVISAFHTVDVYKNGKFQLLFNTKSQLHLVDRNGKYVEHFPAKLPAEASAPLSLFDYKGDKDYRIFLPCKNNRIYNFNIHGSLQEKFATVKTEAEVHLPVQYVKVGESDYLVALDREGKIYTFSRKGEGRIGLRNRSNINCTAFYVDAGNSVRSTYLAYIDDKNGLINKISFDDKKEIVKLHSEIENANITFQLVDENRNMDLILTKEAQLQAFDLTGNLIFEKSFDLPLGKADYYSDESHAVFYALSKDATALFVYDQLKSKLTLVKASSLPLISNLFNDNKKYLLVANGSQLNCVLLN